MKPLFFIIPIFIVFAIVAILLKNKTPKKNGYTYMQKQVLHDEESKYFNLIQLTFPEYKLLAQVSLTSVIASPHIQGKAPYNAICQMSLDYLLIDKDFFPLVVIEFDGKHHLKQVQKNRDQKKDAALNSAGIPVIRFKPKDDFRKSVVPRIREALSGSVSSIA